MGNNRASPKTIKLNVLRLLKRNKREGKGPVTLKDLQRKTGIDYSTLHDHAHGRTSRVTFPALLAIKRALGASWDDLLKVA